MAVNILSRRGFLSRSMKIAGAVALSTLVDIPFVMKRALASGGIGLNNKKLLFIWLRFGNDSLNSVIPIGDLQYALNRPDIGILKDDLTDYTLPGPADFPKANGTSPTYAYDRAIRLGNGFAALHPCLKFLAPVYNAGDLAVIHRVAYPRQSRSHFDSQNYWENGNPNDNVLREGIFYRTILESGLANSGALTGVSIQSALPLILRGSKAAMTNLSDPSRYEFLGIPTSNTNAILKARGAVSDANSFPMAPKLSRELLSLQYENMTRTLATFDAIDFSESANTYRDNDITDGDQTYFDGTAPDAKGYRGYYLFPTADAKNGGRQRPGGALPDATKQVVSSSYYSFFRNLKAAAQVLNETGAIIAGTEIGGFDTHRTQGGATGTHANLQQVVGWAMYALRKYFTLYAKNVNWNDVVVVTLSEFGRTSVENSDNGTDHAEAGAMFVAGGGVKGYGRRPGSGVIGCSPADAIPWLPGPRTTNLTTCGTMFAANPTVTAGYLRRSTDFRSVLGELIRDHLGSDQDQLNRIIPGYATPGEHLLEGGLSSVDGVQINGELNLI